MRLRSRCCPRRLFRSGPPEAIREEAKSASALNHQNIVTIHDIGTESGVSYIAMELVDGTTLRECSRAARFRSRSCSKSPLRSRKGLARAHEAGIVHRDLKPENVMVKKDGLVKILDFGLAKLSSTGSGSDEASQLPTMTGTQPGVVVGTVSSHVARAGERPDRRFSDGPILVGLDALRDGDGQSCVSEEDGDRYAGRNPERGAGADRLDRAADAGAAALVIERCLAKESRQRYASTEDLTRDLASVRDHASELSSGALAVTASREPAGGDSRFRSRRDRRRRSAGRRWGTERSLADLARRQD